MAAAVRGLVGDRRQRERPLIAVSHRLPGDRRSVEEADGAFQTATLSLPPDEPQSAQTETAFIVLEKRGGGIRGGKTGLTTPSSKHLSTCTSQSEPQACLP